MPDKFTPAFCINCGSNLITQVIAGESRPTCPNCGWVYFTDPKVAVAALIIEDGKVLLVHRAIQPEMGKWSLPAGYMNAGEKIESALERECLEETGLQVKVGDLVKIYSGREYPNGADILLAYRTKVTGGDLRAGDDADQVDFFSLDDLPPLAFRSTEELLGSLREQKNPNS